MQLSQYSKIYYEKPFLIYLSNVKELFRYGENNKIYYSLYKKIINFIYIYLLIDQKGNKFE